MIENKLKLKSNLDKFYTKLDIARQCVDFAIQYLPKDSDNIIVVEPSAGSGNFLKPIREKYQTMYAFDIAPESDSIVQQDFLKWYPTEKDKDKQLLFIGNPPFGKKMSAAIAFFNHAAQFGDYICFIFPVSAMKWSVQKQFNQNFKLLDYFYLPENSFTTNENDYNVRSVFQVWSRFGDKDLRLKQQPSITHSDFQLWQYNATQQSVNTVEKDWEFAVYRQGHYDFNQIFTQKDKKQIIEEMTREKKKRQFFFIKPLTEQARQNVLKMDFNALAARNAVTPGFGKADFVSYYMELFDN